MRCAGLFFIFAVLDQQSRDGGAQSRLPLLQRKLDLLPRLFFFSVASQGEDAVDGVPELRERAAQKRALLGSAARGGESGFEAHRVVEIGADALKLRRPCRQRIWFIAADHVAHGDREQVQVVLDAQQLQ